MFSTSSANLTHLVPKHHVVNVLVPALAKLAAQLVADLLIAVCPPAAALLIDQLLRAHAHAQHLLDLEARRWLSLWRTAHTAGNAARAAARAAVCAACTARLCSEGCLRSHAAFQAHPRTAACETICDALDLSIASQDGAQTDGRTDDRRHLFLRSRVCSLASGVFAQP